MNSFIREAMERSRHAAGLRQAVASPDSLVALASQGGRPDFARAVRRDEGPVRIIAEIKRRSPSAGEIDAKASVARTAAVYEREGAAAVSVLTSEYGFGGRAADIAEARSSCGLALLCKDFISTPYQVMEALALGASAVLLIADALPPGTLASLVRLSREAGGESLVEAHTPDGLERALESGASVIGINNRDLETLEVDIGTTERLVEMVPSGVTVVSESGIRTRRDVVRMEALGVDALLIGEALMRGSDPAGRFAQLCGGDRVPVPPEM